MTRGIAALCLYRETIASLRTVMYPDHLQDAEQAMQIVEHAEVLHKAMQVLEEGGMCLAFRSVEQLPSGEAQSRTISLLTQND